MSAGSSGVYRLPTLVPGVGERRSDCALYATADGGGCLARFVRAEGQGTFGRGGYWRERDAHCPPGCPSYAPAPRWAAVAAAHAYGTRHALAEAAALSGEAE